jgi:hypothetical protein
MKVGDLVRCFKSFGLIVRADEQETLVKWCDTGIVEDTDMYSNIEVINASR